MIKMNENNYFSSIAELKAELISQWDNRLRKSAAPKTTIRYKDTDYFKRQDPDMNPDTIIYEHIMRKTISDQGELTWGQVKIYPGQIKDQYFCTKGHFHINEETEEYLLCMKGEGLIMYCSKQGECWCDELHEGSFYRIPPMMACRVINISDEPLMLSLCLPGKEGFKLDCGKLRLFPCHVYDDDGEIAMLVDLEEKPNRPSDFSPEECLRLLNANTEKASC